MFNRSIEDRLSAWYELRQELETCQDPLLKVWNFWKDAPFIPYNRKVDPYNQYNWPTPWEIIVENKYDDFTKSLMIGWSLKSTNKFRHSDVELKTFLDNVKKLNYNIICVDNKWAINCDSEVPILINSLPESFSLENIIEVKAPR